METLVKSIKFDFFYNNEWHRGLDSGYGVEDNIDREYIHTYDGPWFMLELGDEVFDFQIYEDEDSGKLKIDAYKCLIGDDGYCYDKNWLETAHVDNIKIEYETINEC